MRKTPFFQIVREEVLRGLVWATAFVVFSIVGLVGVAYASSGGRFGEILNKILASGNWENPGDGKVRNAEKLGGASANQFTSIKPNQTCSAGKCIVGIKSDGTIDCR